MGRLTSSLDDLLRAAWVDDAVYALRPDYRAVLVVATGLLPGPSDEQSEELLLAAEASAQQALDASPIEDLAHVAAWRATYRGFGAKPQRTRNSLEALLRRAPAGLPRVNRLTDIYNAISVLHRIPVGGEDLDRYAGPARLVRAVGDEAFDTVAGGEVSVEHPDPGEVVWRDDVGVTCRRWNWRQARRTGLSEGTTSALFILDALAPLTDARLEAAADDLCDRLSSLGPQVGVRRRLLRQRP